MSKNDITVIERLDRCEQGLIAIETILRTAFPTFFDPQGEQSQGEQSQGDRPPEQLVALFLANNVEEFGLKLVQEILAQFDDDTSVAGLLEEFDKLVNNSQEGNENDDEKTIGSAKEGPGETGKEKSGEKADEKSGEKADEKTSEKADEKTREKA